MKTKHTKNKKKSGKHENPEIQKECFSFRLKNLTDDKLYDVNLIEYDFKDLKDKIQYVGIVMDYNNMLRLIGALKKSDGFMVTSIHLYAECEHEPFAIKQVQNNVKIIHQSLSGVSYSRVWKLKEFWSFEQEQKNIVDIAFEDTISLTNQLKIQAEFLMPETELWVTVFFQKTAL